MKKTILFLAFFLLFSFSLWSQKLSFGMKTGVLCSKIKFDWTENVTTTGTAKLRPTYALFAEGQLFDFIYLGAEMGTCSYLRSLNFKYNYSTNADNTRYTLQGWFQQEQTYFAVTPQLKLGKKNWLSFGCGFAIYNNYINKFINGLETSTTDGISSVSITDLI